MQDPRAGGPGVAGEDEVAAGGASGSEITHTLIGDYAGRPDAFASALDARGLTLAALAMGSDTGFTLPGMRAKEPEAARALLKELGEQTRDFPQAQALLRSVALDSPAMTTRNTLVKLAGATVVTLTLKGA